MSKPRTTKESRPRPLVGEPLVMPKPNLAIVVLGMHRSGTSALGGLLRLLGADLGSRLHPGDRHNEAGYFEHLDLLEAHEQVLRALQTTWDDLRPLPEGWESREAVRACRLGILSILRREFVGSPLWAVKDPRLCRLLPLWRGLFAEVAAEPRFVLVVRHPSEVAASLATRDQLPASKSHLLYLEHLLSAERLTRGQPRVFVTYDQLLSDGVGTARRVGSALGITWPVAPAAAGSGGFLRRSLRHERARGGPPLSEDLSPLPRATQCYWAMAEAAAGGPDPGPALDSVAEALRAARALLSPWLLELDSGLVAARASSAALAVEVDQSRRNIDSLASQVEAARRAHEQRDRMEVELRGALRSREAEVDQSRRNIDSLASQVEAARRAYEERDRAEAELRGALESREQEIAEARRLVEALEWLRRHDELAREGSKRQPRSPKRRWERLRGLAPLRRVARFLARGLSTQGLAKPEGPFRFAIDGGGAPPGSGAATITGWCFAVDGLAVNAVRVRVGTEVFPAEYGLCRPDVAAAYPGLPGADRSGFRFAADLPFGSHRLLLEAGLGQGAWEPAGQHELSRPAPPVLAHFDTPHPWLATTGPVRFAGWCFHPKLRVERLAVSLGTWEVNCFYGLHRPDVGAYFEGASQSEHSGFEAICQLEPGRHRVMLKAHLQGGQVLTFPSPEPLVVKRRRIRDRLGALASRSLRSLPRGQMPAMKAEGGTGIAAFRPPEPTDSFVCWQRVNSWNERAREDLQGRLDAFPGRLPSVSLVLEVKERSRNAVERTLESVIGQLLSGWEMWVVPLEGLDPWLDQLPRRDARIRPFIFDGAGRLAALNAAVARAAGDFVAFLQEGDVLPPDALAEAALYVAQRPETDFLYSDDDDVDAEGRRSAPRFRPAWSPELLLATAYVGGLEAVRRTLFQAVGGLREGLEGVEDYDLALRIGERARHVGHVPGILRHRRCGGLPPREPREGRARAVREAFERRGVEAVARPRMGAAPGDAIVHDFPDDGPPVAILVCPAEDPARLEACLESLGATSYRNYTVEVLAGVSSASEPAPDRAAVKNAAGRAAEATHLLFLDGELVPANPEWLRLLVGYASLPGVGAVGGLVANGAGRILSAGFGGGRDASEVRSLFAGLAVTDAIYRTHGDFSRNCAAVGDGCLLTPRSVFLELGGFDERGLGRLHEVDYCYRLRDLGRRVVFSPGTHLVSAAVPSPPVSAAGPREEAEFRRRYRGRRDPSRSPHLVPGEDGTAIQPRRLVSGGGRPIRAVLCSFTLNWEGAPYSQFELTASLRDRGVLEPLVYCTNDGPLRAAYAERDIEVVVGPHPLAGVLDGGDYERAVKRFAGFLEARDIELVYANTVHTFYAIEAAERLGLPSVWNIRESEPWASHFSQFHPEIAERATGSCSWPGPRSPCTLPSRASTTSRSSTMASTRAGSRPGRAAPVTGRGAPWRFETTRWLSSSWARSASARGSWTFRRPWPRCPPGPGAGSGASSWDIDGRSPTAAKSWTPWLAFRRRSESGSGSFPRPPTPTCSTGPPTCSSAPRGWRATRASSWRPWPTACRSSPRRCSESGNRSGRT